MQDNEYFEYNLKGKNIIFSGWKNISIKGIKFHNTVSRSTIVFENLLSESRVILDNIQIGSNYYITFKFNDTHLLQLNNFYYKLDTRNIQGYPLFEFVNKNYED